MERDVERKRCVDSTTLRNSDRIDAARGEKGTAKAFQEQCTLNVILYCNVASEPRLPCGWSICWSQCFNAGT